MYTCDTCNKLFKRKHNMEIHIDKCIESNCDDNKKIIEINNKISCLKKQLKIIQNKPNSKLLTNFDIIVSKTQFANDTSKVMYGDREITSYEKNMMSVLNCSDNEIVKLVKLIYLNRKYPENHSICVKNIKDDVIYVFKNYKWKTDIKNVFLESLYSKMLSYLLLNIQKIRHLLPNDIQDNYEILSRKFYNSKTEKNTISKLGLLFYNNLDMINI